MIFAVMQKGKNMRLIDADALLNRMQKDPLFDLVERYGVSGVIEAEPTVDAVPVIRCKDCKYAIDEYGDGDCYCRNERSMLRYIGVDWNHYCAWAVRKDEK